MNENLEEAKTLQAESRRLTRRIMCAAMLLIITRLAIIGATARHAIEPRLGGFAQVAACVLLLTAVMPTVIKIDKIAKRLRSL
jgi:uncharacterized membrane protein